MTHYEFYGTNKNIVLVGMMGAGKTTVGKKLALMLGRDFIDTDIVIQKLMGCTIDKILADFGEIFFRKKEQEVIKKSMEKNACIISTGGGGFIDVINRKIIKELSISVWLKTDLNLLIKRLKNEKENRYILQKGDYRTTLKKLFLERELIYSQADIHVNSGIYSVMDIVNNIIELIKENEYYKKYTNYS